MNNLITLMKKTKFFALNAYLIADSSDKLLKI